MIEALKSDIRLWDLFTKKEEYETQLLDKYHRYPYYLSNNRNVFTPEVSDFLVKNGLKIKYPNGSKFAVCLTHDIDNAYYSELPLGLTLKAFKQLQIKESLRMLFSRGNKKLFPYPTFSKIMDLEEKYKAKSSFYFLALDKHNIDYSYKIEELDEELKEIIDRGWGIGLHGGHEAYNSKKELKKQKERLEDVIKTNVIGYRNHYLRFKVPTTWQLLKNTGFKYDATFGYFDCVGFRNGTCHPFKPYNLNTNQYIDILEIPITVMAPTFFNYMKLDIKNAWEITKQLIDTVKKYNGVITFLWHNTDMIGKKLELYEKILKYSKENNAWMTSAEEIADWWKNHACQNFS